MAPNPTAPQSTPPRPKGSGALAQLFFGLLTAVIAVSVLSVIFPEYGKDLRLAYNQIYAQVLPCRNPETFSIGTVDSRFNVSKKDFLSAVEEAKGVWERAAGRPLFSLVDSGGAVDVSLDYDYRQAATDQLKKIGISIDSTKAGYDKLQAQYQAMEATYTSAKAAFDAASAAHEKRVQAYEKEVASWNAKGGAPKDVYDQLNAERASIDAEANALNTTRTELNEQVNRINATVTVVNRLASTLNIAADTYNGVSTSRGSEFEEGLFTGNESSGTIQIFEFEDRAKLIRVLAHEFGHALGMQHVADPTAIMYRLNSGVSETPSAADIAEMKRVCKMQ